MSVLSSGSAISIDKSPVSRTFFLSFFLYIRAYLFHETAVINTECCYNRYYWFDFYLIWPLKGCKLFNSSEWIPEILETDGYLRRHSMKPNRNRFGNLALAAFWGHKSRGSTVEDALDWTNLEKKRAEMYSFVVHFDRVRDYRKMSMGSHELREGHRNRSRDNLQTLKVLDTWCPVYVLKFKFLEFKFLNLLHGLRCGGWVIDLYVHQSFTYTAQLTYETQRRTSVRSHSNYRTTVGVYLHGKWKTLTKTAEAC